MREQIREAFHDIDVMGARLPYWIVLGVVAFAGVLTALNHLAS